MQCCCHKRFMVRTIYFCRSNLVPTCIRGLPMVFGPGRKTEGKRALSTGLLVVMPFPTVYSCFTISGWLSGTATGPAPMAERCSTLLLTACRFWHSSFKSGSSHLEVLPMTWGKTVVFTACSGFLCHWVVTKYGPYCKSFIPFEIELRYGIGIAIGWNKEGSFLQKIIWYAG